MSASDGEMAIQMLSENNYDLSLIDLYLPKADGFQVLAHLQRVSSSTSTIVMTGHGSIESAVEAMKKGAVDYLTKPVAFDQLRIVIKKALDVRRLQQENWRFVPGKFANSANCSNMRQACCDGASVVDEVVSFFKNTAQNPCKKGHA